MAYKLIRTEAIAAVSEVRLYDTTIEHVRRAHPEVPAELPSIEAALENAIIRPTSIERSYGNSYVYVDAGSTNAAGDPLRVPIKLVSGTSARVKTFYFASTGSDRNVIWRRGGE